MTDSRVIRQIRDLDPDGWETKPSAKDYDQFERRVREGWGDQAWQDYIRKPLL